MSGCCPSVEVEILQDGQHAVITNKSSKNIVAYAFDGEEVRGGRFTEMGAGSHEVNLGNVKGKFALASVVFDDGSFEGDEKLARFDLLAMEAASEAHQEHSASLKAVADGTVSFDTALSNLGEGAATYQAKEISDRDAMARDSGRSSVLSSHRWLLEQSKGDRDTLKRSLEAMDNRYRPLKGKVAK